MTKSSALEYHVPDLTGSRVVDGASKRAQVMLSRALIGFACHGAWCVCHLGAAKFQCHEVVPRFGCSREPDSVTCGWTRMEG